MTRLGSQSGGAVLLDEQPLFLEALERVVRSLEIEVVGKTTDADVALDLLAARRPALFILGIDEQEGIDQVDCVREARTLTDDLVVLVCSSSRRPDTIEQCLAAGADAYVLKTASRGDLVSTILQAFDRTMYLFSRPQVPAPLAALPTEERPQLTNREIDVLRLVAEGWSNAQVAQHLWLSEATIKLYLSRIYAKLGVTNRTSASLWAQLQGLLEGEPDAGSPEASREAVAFTAGRFRATA